MLRQLAGKKLPAKPPYSSRTLIRRVVLVTAVNCSVKEVHSISTLRCIICRSNVIKEEGF